MKATTAAAVPDARIQRVSHLDETQLQLVADLLIDCVDGGASVSFMQPLKRPDALAFWQRVAADVAQGERALLLAHDAQGIAWAGTAWASSPATRCGRAAACATPTISTECCRLDLHAR